MDPRMLTSIGLGMDIVGIVFLFTCGGIAGEWIDRGKQRLLIEADDVQVARDRRIALACIIHEGPDSTAKGRDRRRNGSRTSPPASGAGV